MKNFMNIEHLFTEKDIKTLQQARETYGFKKQVCIAAEECIELAKELIKVIRYDNFNDAVINTRIKVIEELADVFITLDHVIHAYSIVETDLKPQIYKKMNRLRYWLKCSNSSEFTMQYRNSTSCEIIEDLESNENDTYENKNVKLFETEDKMYRDEI